MSETKFEELKLQNPKMLLDDDLEAIYELEDEANRLLGRENPPMSKKYRELIK